MVALCCALVFSVLVLLPIRADDEVGVSDDDDTYRPPVPDVKLPPRMLTSEEVFDSLVIRAKGITKKSRLDLARDAQKRTSDLTRRLKSKVKSLRDKEHARHVQTVRTNRTSYDNIVAGIQLDDGSARTAVLAAIRSRRENSAEESWGAVSKHIKGIDVFDFLHSALATSANTLLDDLLPQVAQTVPGTYTALCKSLLSKPELWRVVNASLPPPGLSEPHPETVEAPYSPELVEAMKQLEELQLEESGSHFDVIHGERTPSWHHPRDYGHLDAWLPYEGDCVTSVPFETGAVPPTVAAKLCLFRFAVVNSTRLALVRTGANITDMDFSVTRWTCPQKLYFLRANVTCDTTLSVQITSHSECLTEAVVKSPAVCFK